MKATGIVRRIDDLGRVVIPKEIRRSLNIKDGDPLELYLTNDQKGLVLRKYNDFSVIKDLLSELKFYAQTDKLLNAIKELEEIFEEEY